MDHIINVSAVRDKMNPKPKMYRMYNFFIGMDEQLSKDDIKSIISIIDVQHKKLVTDLKERMKGAK